MISRLRNDFWYWRRTGRERAANKLAFAVAFALPRRVAMWSYVRVHAHATTGPWGNDHPDAVTYGQAMDRWQTNDRQRRLWDAAWAIAVLLILLATIASFLVIFFTK